MINRLYGLHINVYFLKKYAYFPNNYAHFFKCAKTFQTQGPVICPPEGLDRSLYQGSYHIVYSHIVFMFIVQMVFQVIFVDKCRLTFATLEKKLEHLSFRVKRKLERKRKSMQKMPEVQFYKH